jgi:glycerophosphoryl diester phosphodiesterase
MHRLPCLLLPLALSACGTSQPLTMTPGEPLPVTPTATPTPPPAPRNTALVIAHRGASGHAPEHTFAAWDLAIEMGADYLEQDIQQTLDGELVVLHDDTLDRTARGPAENCTGPVRTKTLAQLRTCEVGGWFNERFPDRARPEYVGQPLPTLREVFERYGNRVNYYIETKSPESTDLRMEQRLYDLLVEFGLRDAAVQRRQVYIQSFSPLSLLRMQAIDRELPLVQLTPAGGAATLPIIATYAVGVGPSAGQVSADFVRQAHALGLDVHPYTVNNPADLERLLALCVDGIFTDFPDRMISARETAPVCER